MSTDYLLGIAAVLEQVERPGSFVAHGLAESPLPLVEVEGFGPVPLPLVPVVMGLLRPHTTEAPYGRGGETLIDPGVRSSRQIDASKIRMPDQGLGRTLEAITREAARGLGADGEIEARLYKLLLYERGGFFLPHRDTEKEPGMFATLVVVLPSAFEGGALVVGHGEEEVVLDGQSPSVSSLAWMAFYADCTHEVRPITEGVRAVLVFNLVRAQGALPAPGYPREAERLARYLVDWESDGWPRKLCAVLDHHYTPAELSWRALKGADQARATVLLAAAREVGFTTHLAMVSISETWSAAETSYRSRRSRWYQPEPEEVELYDLIVAEQVVHHWRTEEDEPTDAPPLPLEEDELLPPDALEDEEPDESHYHEATGNEGATVERTYRRAAIVLWPPTHVFQVIAQAGPGYLVHSLEVVARAESPDRAFARGLCTQVASTLRRHSTSTSEQLRLLAVLTRLGLGEGVVAYLEALCNRHGVPAAVAAALTPALDLVEPAQAAASVASVVRANGWSSLGDSASILEHLTRASAHPAETWVVALDEALALLEAGPPPSPWRTTSRAPLASGLLGSLLLSTLRLATDHGDRLRALTRSLDVSFDDQVLPGLLTAAAAPERTAQALGPWLRDALGELERRLAEPLVSPVDHRRDPPSCSCEDCAQLGAFLCSPTRASWDFAARKDRRYHVESTIRRERLDVDTVTVKRGNPHTLRCTKNRARYEARVAQRRLEKSARADLEAAVSALG